MLRLALCDGPVIKPWLSVLCLGEKSIYVGGLWVGRMDRHAKIEKINAEIARMEVEIELEEGVGGKMHLGSGYVACVHEHGQELGSRWNPFKSTTKMDGRANADHFRANVLDPALQMLARSYTVVAPENVTAVEYNDHANLGGTFSNYAPGAVWKFSIEASMYYLFLFVDVDVQYRIMKLIPQQKPKLEIIKPIPCWSGELKKDCIALVYALVGQVEKLNNATDGKLTAKTSK